MFWSTAKIYIYIYMDLTVYTHNTVQKFEVSRIYLFIETNEYFIKTRILYVYAIDSKYFYNVRNGFPKCLFLISNHFFILSTNSASEGSMFLLKYVLYCCF